MIELGATVTSILVPDKHGEFDDVTTGFDTLAGKSQEHEVRQFSGVIEIYSRVSVGIFATIG